MERAGLLSPLYLEARFIGEDKKDLSNDASLFTMMLEYSRKEQIGMENTADFSLTTKKCIISVKLVRSC